MSDVRTIITNSGAVNTYIVDEPDSLTITEGLQGPQGEQGPQGPVGASGDGGGSGLYIDVTDYSVTGNGTTDDYAALNTLINSFGSAKTHIYFPNGEYVIGSNFTLPSNVKMTLAFNARIKVSSTKTLTIHSRFEADMRQNIFTGAGSVRFYPGSTPYGSVMWWGALGDGGTTDNTTKFQAAVDSLQQLGRVYIPGNQSQWYYKITSTVSFYSPTRVFSGWDVFGDISTDESQFQELTSKIVYTGLSGPCFNFRGMRLTKIHDFTLQGTNDAPATASNDTTTAAWDEATWITSGLASDSYNVHSGIAFDWVGGSGTSTPWSAQVDMFNLKISKFVVGIAISPNSGFQADTIDCRKIKIINCTYGVCVAQDQCRAITFTNMWMDNLYCAYTNRRFGRAVGSAFNIFGGQYTGIFKIFDCHTQYRGQMSINGIFLEACGLMGTLQSTGSNNNAVVFTGCELNFDNDGYGGEVLNFTTPWLWLLGGSNITFVGCNIKSQKGYLGLCSGFAGRFTFSGCSFPVMDGIFEAGGVQRENRVRYINCSTTGTFEFNDNPFLNPDEKKYVRSNISSVITYTNDAGGNSTGQVNYLTVAGTRPHSSGSIAALVSDAGQTYQKTGLSSTQTAFYKVGDFCNAYIGTTYTVYQLPLTLGGLETACLRVTDVTSTTVTFEKLAPEVDLSNTTGNWGTVYTFGRSWVSVKKITGTFAANNQATSVTNVARLSVGDWCCIGVGDNVQQARITAISSTTVTFNSTVNLRGIHEIYGVRLINAFAQESDYQSGAGTPTVNARYTGDSYLDTSNSNWYKAISKNNSTAANDWKILT